MVIALLLKQKFEMQVKVKLKVKIAFSFSFSKYKNMEFKSNEIDSNSLFNLGTHLKPKFG